VTKCFGAHCAYNSDWPFFPPSRFFAKGPALFGTAARAVLDFSFEY
jgi:hypothetical protein